MEVNNFLRETEEKYVEIVKKVHLSLVFTSHGSEFVSVNGKRES